MAEAAGETGNPRDDLHTYRTYALPDGRILQITSDGRLRARSKFDSWGMTVCEECDREWCALPTGELMSKDGRRILVDALGHIRAASERFRNSLTPVECTRDPSGVLKLVDGRELLLTYMHHLDSNDGCVVAKTRDAKAVVPVPDQELPHPPVWKKAGSLLSNTDGLILYVDQEGCVGATESGLDKLDFLCEATGHDNYEPGRQEWAVDNAGVLSLAADGRQVYIDSYGRVCASKPDCGGLAPCVLDGSGVLVAPDGRKLRLDKDGWAYAVAEGASPLVVNRRLRNPGAIWTYDQTGALTTLSGHQLFMNPRGEVCAGKDKWRGEEVEKEWASHASWNLDSSGRVTLQGQSFAMRTNVFREEEVWLDVLTAASNSKWRYDEATGAIANPDGLQLVIGEKYGYASAVPAAKAMDIDPKLRTWKVAEENTIPLLTDEELMNIWLKKGMGLTDDEIQECSKVNDAMYQLWERQQEMKQEMDEGDSLPGLQIGAFSI